MSVADSGINSLQASAPASLQQGPFLATKLFVPRPRPTLVARPRLLARVEAGLRGPLTLLAAPAGWGKTSVLSAWCAAAADAGDSSWAVAWVSLDAGDNDPIRFWTYVLTALDKIQPGISDVALMLLRSPQPPAIETVLTPLLNAVAAAPAEIVLVLDDYHVITVEAVHAALALVLDRLPSRLHLVLSTREDPPLPLARLRAQRALTELRAADLRFTPEETTAFLTAMLGVTLSMEAIAALETRSEGWIAALQLAALSVQGRSPSEVEAFISAFTGSNRHIVDYLLEEVLAGQPPALQDFVLRTTVLDRFCAPLAEQLLSEGKVADVDARAEPRMAPVHRAAQALLEQAQHANLFLVPLDDEQRWYRYHHLFADALRGRLRQADPDLYTELQRRASAWFAAQGLVEEAVEHALAAGDFARAADLIEKHALAISVSGQTETVLGWLQGLPKALARVRPILGASQAATLFFRGETPEVVEARLRDAEAALTARRQVGVLDTERRSIEGMLALVRALVATQLGNVQTSVPLAKEAHDLLPDSESVWRAITQVLLDQSYLLTGDVKEPSVRALAEHHAAARAAGNLQLAQASLMDLGHVQRLRGHLRAAMAAYEEAMGIFPGGLLAEDTFNGPGCAFGLGETRLEWSDLDEAERLLTRGIQMLARWAVPARSVAMGYVALARLRQARGDPTGALDTLDTLTELAAQRHFASAWPTRGAAMRAQIQLAQGDLAEAVRWAEGCGLSVNDAEPTFLMEPVYLALVRVRIAQGRAGSGGPFLDEAERLLERLQADAEGKGRGRSVLELLLLRALALRARHDTRGAVGALLRALTLAAPEGYVRLFADEGAPMAALLGELSEAADRRRLAVSPDLLDYAGFLRAACQAPDGGTRPYLSVSSDATTTARPLAEVLSLLDPLTEREVEVLRLLAEGASNAAIAATLVVAEGTAKKHVFNVCRKLGVQNRTQAVARARAVHLL